MHTGTTCSSEKEDLLTRPTTGKNDVEKQAAAAAVKNRHRLDTSSVHRGGRRLPRVASYFCTIDSDSWADSRMSTHRKHS
jgi:hypothetical protein